MPTDCINLQSCGGVCKILTPFEFDPAILLYELYQVTFEHSEFCVSVEKSPQQKKGGDVCLYTSSALTTNEKCFVISNIARGTAIQQGCPATYIRILEF